VAADLEQLNGNEKSLANRTLRIPTKHADACLSALNQRVWSSPQKMLTRKRIGRPLSLTHRVCAGT